MTRARKLSPADARGPRSEPLRPVEAARVASPSRDRRAQARDVARRYYYDGLSQEQIAAELGVSRPVVSRLLAEARDRGIVEIIVHDHPEARPVSLSPTPAPAHWGLRAACAGVAVGRHLGPVVVPPALTPEDRGNARAWIAAYCDGCPVTGECGAFGREQRLTGVYGGEWLADGEPDPAHLEEGAAA